jgi:hypothetical protein
MCGIWGLIFVGWTTYLYLVVPTHERHPLQKACIFLLVLKCMEVGLEGGWFSMCPWYAVTEKGVQYV